MEVFSMKRINANLMFKISIVCLSSFFAFSAYAADSQSQTDIKKAYQDWCAAIGTAKGNPQDVVKFYAPGATLLATFSSTILKNTDNGLDPYFKKLTSHKDIKCTTDSIITKVNHDMGFNTGFYTFSYVESDGSKKVVPARFTFVYEKENQKWMIVNHHSSVVPK